MQTIERIAPAQIVERAKSLGIVASLAKDFKQPLFHEGAIPNSITAISDEARGMPDKPAGALWLSTGDLTPTGVRNEWRTWCLDNDYSSKDIIDGDSTNLAILHDDAVILEFDESSRVFAPRLIDPDAPPLLGNSLFTLTREEFISGYNTVPWAALRDLGVHAVRVNGGVCYDSFYGWDVDSVAVLQEGFVKSWSTVAVDKAWENRRLEVRSEWY